MDKVSILSPCYNGEKFIARFLEAILKQTYPNIQLVVVDDGSTDKTLEIMRSYQGAFESRGYEYHVLTQENGGQASAINRGLSVISGKYFTWPDSDDFLFPESIAKRVEFLENNPQYGMVLSNGNEYDEKGVTILRERVVKREQAENLLDCLLDMTAMFNNNGYLVHTDLFFKVYPNKRIYESRAGQNIQILLPLAVMSKCGYIEEPLYGRTIRAGSHSKQLKDVEKRNEELDKIVYNTILSIPSGQALLLLRYTSRSIFASILYYQGADSQKEKHYYKALKQAIKKLKSYQRKIRLHKIKKRLTGKK